MYIYIYTSAVSGSFHQVFFPGILLVCYILLVLHSLRSNRGLLEGPVRRSFFDNPFRTPSVFYPLHR